MPFNPYVAVTVNLATAGTRYSLYDLIAAIDATATPSPRELTIRAARLPTPNAGIVYVGDGLVATTRCGFEVAPGESYTMRDDKPAVPLRNISVVADTDNQKLNVQVIGC